jgi:outer membrane receptor protein involved in Fe transport
MQFNNQIIGLGQLNAFGYTITTNVKSSQRMGVELELAYKLGKNITLYNNSSFSNNQIKEINQHLSTTYGVSDTVISYKNVASALSPNVIINQGVKANVTKWLAFDVIYRYVGLQYLDNTGDKSIVAPAFNYVDVNATFKLSKWIKTGIPTLSLRVNNMTNQKYATTGSVSAGTNTISETGARGAVALFMPAAEVNYFVTLGWKF